MTPFTFIDFFVHKIDPVGKYARTLVSLATEITLATTKGHVVLVVIATCKLRKCILDSS